MLRKVSGLVERLMFPSVRQTTGDSLRNRDLIRQIPKLVKSEVTTPPELIGLKSCAMIAYHGVQSMFQAQVEGQ